MKEVVMTYSDAVVTIHIPELSKEERCRRMKQLKGAAQGLLMELMKVEGNINNDKDKQKMER
jgi:ribosome recycling factor